MPQLNRQSEKGISLMFSLLALLLLSAIAAGMMFMSSTESSVSNNFKAEETAYFAARAGVEEVRDRMLTTHPATIAALLPATPPTAAGGVLYVLQNGVTMANVTNVTPNNPLADDELCHDYGNPSFGGMTWQPANVRCIDLPAGAAWYTSPPPASVAPYALDYKWVRVSLKQNNSSSGYLVDPAQPGGNQVCWNGTSEIALPAGFATCNLVAPIANPVYLVTALAVTAGGARRLVQQEIAQTPIGGSNYGLYATGTTCGALTLGGGAQTFSFNSATENPPANPPNNINTSGGNVGTNGNMGLNGSNTAVHGTSASAIAGVGNCNQGNGITVSGGANLGTPAVVPPVSPTVPPLPNPLPPTKGCPTYCYNSNQTLPPGAYGNVNVTGGAQITLQGGTVSSPSVYTMNSISLAGGSTLIITGPVVINIAGVNQQNPVDFTGGTFQNNTYVPGDFVINYGGSANINISGGAAAFAVINAPNANISFSGGSNFYGQAIGRTISDTGGTNIYYDQHLQTPGPNNNAYFEIALRELSY
jgi:hypothetical protein